MSREEQKKKENASESMPSDMMADKRINTDPNGTWTGVPTDFPYEMPVQDADDL